MDRQDRAGTPPPKSGTTLSERDENIGKVANRHWELTGALGRGGAGVVYASVHQKTGQRAALKQLRTNWADNDELLERFFQEVQILRRLRHHNIVEIYDVGFQEDLGFFLVMELLSGQDLRARYDENPDPMPWNELLAIVSQVCDAMAFAHSKGVVHRDIKPANIFLCQTGRRLPHVKLLDFGIAKALDTDDIKITQAGMMVGSPAYLAPEQALGENIDHRADIYSLSVILFELLTRQSLFTMENSFRYMMDHVHKPPRSLSEAKPDISFPEGLEALVRDGLAKEAPDRPQSLLEYKERLLAAMQAPVQPAAPQPGERAPIDPQHRVHLGATRPTPGASIAIATKPQHKDRLPSPAPIAHRGDLRLMARAETHTPGALPRATGELSELSSSEKFSFPSAKAMPIATIELRAPHTPPPQHHRSTRSRSNTGSLQPVAAPESRELNSVSNSRTRSRHNSSAVWVDAIEEERKKRRLFLGLSFVGVTFLLIVAALLMGK